MKERHRKSPGIRISTLRCGLVCFVAAFLVLFFSGLVTGAQPQTLEKRLFEFIQQFYRDQGEVRIQLHNLASDVRDHEKVRNIVMAKIPEPSGEGLCLVELEEKNGRTRTVYVPFKVFPRVRLLVLSQNVKKGDRADREKFTIKETHLGGSSAQYVTQREDLEGKIFKKDLPAGTILTVQHLDERVLVNRGELVSIVVDNGRLLARAKGKALEKGRIGDNIRVRNVSSGREVVGQVTGDGTVTVKL